MLQSGALWDMGLAHCRSIHCKSLQYHAVLRFHQYGCSIRRRQMTWLHEGYQDIRLSNRFPICRMRSFSSITKYEEKDGVKILTFLPYVLRTSVFMCSKEISMRSRRRFSTSHFLIWNEKKCWKHCVEILYICWNSRPKPWRKKNRWIWMQRLTIDAILHRSLFRLQNQNQWNVAQIVSNGLPRAQLHLIYPDNNVHGANMGPSGADRTQMGPMLAPWTLLSGHRLACMYNLTSHDVIIIKSYTGQNLLYMNGCGWDKYSEICKLHTLRNKWVNMNSYRNKRRNENSVRTFRRDRLSLFFMVVI